MGYIEAKPNTVVLLVGVAVLLLLVGWLLFAPITININTWKNDYYIRMWGLGAASLILVEDNPIIRMQVFFWRKDFYPLQTNRKPKKPKKKRKTRKVQKKFEWKFVLRMLKTFRVQQFRLELDTDDYVTNAYLYPLFYFASRPQRQLSVNFEGKTNLLIKIENRLSRIVRVFLFQSNFLTKKR